MDKILWTPEKANQEIERLNSVIDNLKEQIIFMKFIISQQIHIKDGKVVWK